MTWPNHPGPVHICSPFRFSHIVHLERGTQRCGHLSHLPVGADFSVSATASSKVLEGHSLNEVTKQSQHFLALPPSVSALERQSREANPTFAPCARNLRQSKWMARSCRSHSACSIQEPWTWRSGHLTTRPWYAQGKHRGSTSAEASGRRCIGCQNRHPPPNPPPRPKATFRTPFFASNGYPPRRGSGCLVRTRGSCSPSQPCPPLPPPHPPTPYPPPHNLPPPHPFLLPQMSASGRFARTRGS